MQWGEVAYTEAARVDPRPGCPELRFPFASQFLQTTDGIMSRSSLHALPFIIHLPVYYSTPCNLATSKITVVWWISRYRLKAEVTAEERMRWPGFLECETSADVSDPTAWVLRPLGGRSCCIAGGMLNSPAPFCWTAAGEPSVLLEHRVWNNYISKRLQALMACHK